MGCNGNGIEHLSKEVSEGKKGFRQMDDDELVSVRVDNDSQDDLVSSKEAEDDWKPKLGQKSSHDTSLSRRRGLEHCITAPVGTERNPLIAEDEIMISRSMTEKRGLRRHDLMLDRLSEHEKQELIANLVKIQNDGPVEVDVERSASVASELLELQTFEESTVGGSLIFESKKSVPRLQIVILVVGTRGDVQPFLAIAKRLQEYGHRVRLATHANFSTFVRSAGVNFYPLGGDPRILAG